MELREFATSAIGVPFLDKGRDRSGLDCWGVVWLAYREVYGIELPSFADQYAEARARSVPELFRREREVAWSAVRVPAPGDVVILRISGQPWHCGLAIGGREMLHVALGIETCVERIDSLAWRNRLDGFWRHELLA